MHPSLLPADAAPVIPIHLVDAGNWPAFAETLPPLARGFAAAQAYEGAAGKALLLPGEDGRLAGVVFGLDKPGARRPDPFLLGSLRAQLPAGDYALANPLASPLADAASGVLAFVLAGYSFDRYRKPKAKAVRLAVPPGVDAGEIERIAGGVELARDLINTPAGDLGPDALEAAIRALGARFGAAVTSTVGDALIEANVPMVHAVGRAAAVPPRLVDLTWGEPGHPRVTLVGKGVCFDTGGLNIKPEGAMLLMKKDMGGAAAALAAGAMVMDAKLPVRLRILVPAVENAISGSSYRPGDILKSRKGLNVEIGNTDAEGRLVLADALALADEEAPELIVDFATLTGAARVALGPDLPPFYTHDEALAADLSRLAVAVNDPVWRLPLWPPYDPLLDSKIADVNHISGGAFAGSITAALFLNRFVTATASYAHFDIFAWNPTTKPGRPEGGEAQAARLVYALVKERYGKTP